MDGYIAKADGGLDWLEHDSREEDYGFNEFISKIDALVMGGNTFKKVIQFDQWYYGDTKVIVLSRSFSDSEIPGNLKEKVEISRQGPKEILSELAFRKYQNIYVDGGKVIRSFLKEKLIDEIIITIFPIVLGRGIPLFGQMDFEIKLDLINTRSFKTGLVQVHYATKY